MEAFYWGVKLVMEMPSGAFADRFGRRATFAVGLVIEGAGVVTFAFASNFTILLISYVLWSMGFSFRSGNDQAYIYDALAVDDRTGEFSARAGMFEAMTTAAVTLAAKTSGMRIMMGSGADGSTYVHGTQALDFEVLVTRGGLTPARARPRTPAAAGGRHAAPPPPSPSRYKVAHAASGSDAAPGRDCRSSPSSGRRKMCGRDAWAAALRYLGVSFNNLVVAGVLGLILAVPLSVRT